MDKTIAIIGGGISGLSAGIHALQNGYDVTIYEKLPTIGGMCTSWNRKGCQIDGCIHWLTGTNPTSSYYKVWENVGALNADISVYNPDKFAVCDYCGQRINVWADPDKLNSEFKRISPEDGALIDYFTDAIKAYTVFDKVADKPDFMISIPERMIDLMYIRSAIKYMRTFISYSLNDYAQKYTSPALRKLFETIMPGGYTVQYLIITLNNYSRANAGIPQGGSIALTQRMHNRFTSLGGKTVLNAPVKSIRICNGSVAGITLESGEDKFYDSVISCIDSKYLFDKLLCGEYAVKEYEERYANVDKNPIVTSLLLSYSITSDKLGSDVCYMFETTPFSIGASEVDSMYVRNYNYDPTIVGRTKVLEVLYVIKKEDADYWINLRASDKRLYNAEKAKVAEAVRQRIIEHFELDDSDLEAIDVATPATVARYVNAYSGAYMSFVPSGATPILPQNLRIKGIKGLYIGSQWAAGYGGTPLALLSGKYAVQTLCYENGQKFVFGDQNTLLKSE